MARHWQNKFICTISGRGQIYGVHVFNHAKWPQTHPGIFLHPQLLVHYFFWLMSCDCHVTESRSSNLNSNQHCHVGERTGARDGCDIPCHAYTVQACLSDTAVRSNWETRPTFGPEVPTIKTTLIFRTHLNFCSFQSLIVNLKISRIQRKKDVFNHVLETENSKKKVLLTKTVKVSSSSARLQAIKVRAGTVQTLYVTAHFTRTTALHVPALLRFTHSSSTLNESANHPMHWTSQTILYLSSGCRRENNDSLTQVKEAMWLNQYFYYGPLHRRLPFECPVATFLRPFSSLSLKISNGSHNGRRHIY